MDFERIKQNLLGALHQLLVLRMIVSSPSRKVADLPAAYVLLVAVIVPWSVAFLVVLGFLLRYGVRFESAEF